MLGRRQYRIKVLQALYAYFQGGESRLEIAEKNLLLSIDKIYELYYLQLSFLLEVMHFYEFRMEESKGKFYPTPEELNPSHKLINNRLILQLQKNSDLAEKCVRYKFSWTEEQDMVRKTYQKIKASKDYLAYIHSEVSSYREDQDFLEKLFRKYIAKSSDLQFFCEERNIHWVDDFELVAVFVLKTIKLLPESWGEKDTLMDLFNKEHETDPDDDRKFIRDLFMKTIAQSDEMGQLIDTRTRNWELDRIALTDIILIKMALTELLYFSQIPVKVTLNEYIEISKQFSSQKSKLFINGILDKLVIDLTAENKIKKTGRGLMV
ncbi:MAG: transcription antitermination factor NusB [Bacteroidales bacterium]|nr:transcription antitermination factor NusB [Bacteroidales bacterium]MDD4603090.1 transcription antitermination factor NusB [Bacteroidales bacterium]